MMSTRETRARLLHRFLCLAKVTQVIDRLTSIDHADLEADGCEVSLWETKAALGVVTSRFFLARRFIALHAAAATQSAGAAFGSRGKAPVGRVVGLASAMRLTLHANAADRLQCD